MPAFKPALSCIAAAAVLAACGGGGSDPSAGEPRGEAANGLLNLLGAVPGVLGAVGGAPASDAVADEVLVKLRNPADLQPLLAAHGLSLIDQFGTRPIYRLRTSAGADTDALAAQLAADSRVIYAEPNLLHETPEGRRAHVWAIGGNADAYATQWNTSALRLPQAHAISRGAGVKVAVLDTGVDANHPALAGKLLAGFDFVDFDADTSEDGSDLDAGYGHGTHVASLVAQVAPDARIVPIRVLDRHGMGNIWVLAEALVHAIDPDGNPGTDDGMQVVNLSLGMLRPSKLIEDIIDAVTCKDDDADQTAVDDRQRCDAFGGVVVVGAAGNSGDQTPHYPAAEKQEGVLAVAASASNGRLASFSTRGDWVHVAAPGDRIYGAIPGGRWGSWSGTSMAAPMVAGTAALVLSANPGWKATDVTSKVQGNGRALCGTGLKQVDAAASLNGTSGPSIVCG